MKVTFTNKKDPRKFSQVLVGQLYRSADGMTSQEDHIWIKVSDRPGANPNGLDLNDGMPGLWSGSDPIILA